MMKWIKNKFNDEEPNRVDEEQLFEEKEAIDNVKESKTIIRDRRFRFPIVPDEHATHINRKKDESITINKGKSAFSNPYAYKVDEVEEERMEQKKEIDMEVPAFERKEINVEKQQLEEKVHVSEPVKTVKKPFRPTEIPSPIYGYKRPNTGVETSKSYQTQSQSQQSEIDAILRKNRSTFFPNEESPISNEVAAPNPIIVEFELPAIPSFVEELGIHYKNEDVQQVMDVVNELVDEGPIVNTEDEMIEKVNEDNGENEEAYILDDCSEEEVVESVQVESKPCKVEIENNIQIHVHHINETIEKIEQTESIVVDEEERKADEKKDIETQVQRELRKSQEEIAVSVEVEKPKITGEKKRHIPFNVMMLRRDKEAVAKREIVKEKIGIVESDVQVEQPVIEEKDVQVEQSVIEEKYVQVEQPVIEEKEESRELEKIQEINSLPMTTEVIENPSIKEEKEAVKEDIHIPMPYAFPSVNDLEIAHHAKDQDDTWLKEQWELLDTTLYNFNVGAKVINVTQGPAVTRFEVQPEPGVKVNKITNLSDDIKLNLSAKDIRIEAPIPGKNAVGIEVPNKKSNPVFLREILETDAFFENSSPLTIALGLDISGEPIVADIRKMPHGLIAGATGSGKSVCINSLLVSILYKAMPHEVKLLLIDPKMVELAPYNHIPHLVSPVITDAKAATAALKWAVEEMDRRYELFAHAGARDLVRYNDLAKRHNHETLPYLVIVIDELADLMMVAAADVEEAICRIAQKARACGIHLIVATQRPSVDVITGLIKANIPTRIAFTVSSQVDSRTIIDIGGAEKLLGRGDMLFLNNGESKPVRVQGVYVSDDEIERVVQHAKDQMAPNYLFKQEELLTKVAHSEEEDELFLEACEYVVEQGGASASMIQRRFRVGYNRAARLIELMESRGIISEAKGSKPREVLISENDLVAMLEG